MEKEIEKQEANLVALRTQLTAAEAYIQAQRDMLKMLPKENDPARANQLVLRPGSEPAKVRDILKEDGKPMHISEILTKLGRPVNRETRSAISGALSGYVRRGAIFTRPAPNTFALVEVSDDEQPLEPPDDFGSDENT